MRNYFGEEICDIFPAILISLSLIAAVIALVAVNL